MASADFSQFVVTTHFFRIRLLHAPVRPPRVLTHSFPLYLPYLPQTIPCSYRALALLGALPSPAALYMISVRQARVLPPSFFRSRLTTNTLDLGYILPTAGRIRDFHPLECALTGRTRKKKSWNLAISGLFMVAEAGLEPTTSGLWELIFWLFIVFYRQKIFENI